MSEWLFGINAVEGALLNDPANILQVWISRERKDRRAEKLITLAETHRVKLNRPPRAEFERRFARQVHQGAAAEYRPPQLLSEEELPELLEGNALVLILDHVQDPRNFGACLRSAAAAGADAVVFPKNRSAGVGPLARKTAAGAVEKLNLVEVTNLASSMRLLQQHGVWIVGAAGESELTIYEVDLSGAIAIVVGNEGEGLKKLSKKHCDYLAKIPIVNDIESLNVSVATGICLFEAIRQRGSS